MNATILHSDHARDAHLDLHAQAYTRPNPHTVAHTIVQSMVGPLATHDAYGVTITQRCRAEARERQFLPTLRPGAFDTRYIFVDGSSIVVFSSGYLWSVG